MRRFAPDSPANSIWVLISLVGMVLIGLGVVIIVSPEPVLARTNDLTAAVSRYPQIDNTDLDSCSLCHGSSYSLNAYGSDYDTYGFAGTENIDSDGDGFLNIDEIDALTEPGNENDYPLQANEDLDRARAQYPSIVGERLDACLLCHTDETPTPAAYALNTYGAAYNSAGRNLAAFGLIEDVDSDGDTYLNLDEIIGFRFPGDPDDYPVVATDDMNLAVEKYPHIASTDLNACILCHTMNNPTGSDHDLNAYGAAYNGAGRNLDAFDLIQDDDSDGDGFTSIDELDLLFFPGDPADHPQDVDLLLSLYSALPEIESHACHLCHTEESGPDLNPYGVDYLSNGRSRAALVTIENLDSDGDGYCNLDELELGYCPGEPECPTHSESLLLEYPNIEGTRLESCDFCHHTGEAGWPLNSYGLDYNNAGNNRTAFAVIETLDSDGDGYLNIEEIQALTMPGDPMDSPAQNNVTSFVFLPIILNE